MSRSKVLRRARARTTRPTVGVQQFPAANTWSMGVGVQNENEGICRSGDVTQPGPSTNVQEQIEEMRRQIAQLQQLSTALSQQVMQQQQAMQIQQAMQQQQVQQNFMALATQIVNLITQRLPGISNPAAEPGQSFPHAAGIPTFDSNQQTNHGFPQPVQDSQPVEDSQGPSYCIPQPLQHEQQQDRHIEGEHKD